MVTTNLSVEIKRPLAKVFAYLMEPNNYPVWQSGLLQIETTNGMAAGSTISFVAVGLGQKYSMEAVVTENDQRASFAVVARQGPITFESTYQLHPVPDGSRLDLSYKIDTGLVFRLAESALQAISDSKYQADLQSLKVILEST